jgi:3-oxoacyl-[acyl-carrier protein] reductase
MNTVFAQTMPGPAIQPMARADYLHGRRVLITGASGNLGAAIAKRLAAEGAKLVLHYRNNPEPVHALLGDINREYDMAFPVQGTLDRPEAARMVFNEAEDLLGTVDVLINCVGLSRDNSLLMLSDEDAVSVVYGNLAPVVYMSELMRNQNSEVPAGRIINVTSITGLVGQPMRSLYGAAKGAVIAYTKAVAREIAGCGWTANCIAPQVVEGGLADDMTPQAKMILSGVTPLKRACTPDDLTGLAAFLAAEESGYVTGSVMNVTGGLVTW